MNPTKLKIEPPQVRYDHYILFSFIILIIIIKKPGGAGVFIMVLRERLNINEYLMIQSFSYICLFAVSVLLINLSSHIFLFYLCS